MAIFCDHKDSGSIGWDRDRREFCCLICGRRFLCENELPKCETCESRPAVVNLVNALVLIAVLAVQVVLLLIYR